MLKKLYVGAITASILLTSNMQANNDFSLHDSRQYYAKSLKAINHIIEDLKKQKKEIKDLKQKIDKQNKKITNQNTIIRNLQSNSIKVKSVNDKLDKQSNKLIKLNQHVIKINNLINEKNEKIFKDEKTISSHLITEDFTVAYRTVEGQEEVNLFFKGDKVNKIEDKGNFIKTEFGFIKKSSIK